MQVTVKELRRLIRETDASMAGSRPEEHYSNELVEDEAWKTHSVMVPDDVKSSINSYFKSMGLAGAKKKKRSR